MKDTWVKRHKELAIKYDVDMLWFDGWGFPYGDYGKEVCAAFYNAKLQKYGSLNAIVAGKIYEDKAIVRDIERGGSNEILPDPWQGTLTFGSWFYKKDKPCRHNARTVIEMMADMNSKNGNLLLNVELLPDGTIPEDHKVILDEVGHWVNTNAEAIYGSKPWNIYGDNLNSYIKVLENKGVSEADLKALKEQNQSEHFNERTVESPEYGQEEVRFTTNGNTLYVFVLNPKKGKISIPSLAFQTEHCSKKIKSIKLLGSEEKIRFKQNKKGLQLSVPSKRPTDYTAVFKIEGVI